MNHQFRIDSVYRIEDGKLTLRPGEIDVAADIDEQFADHEDTERPIVVSGVQLGDFAVYASLVELGQHDTVSEPYFVTSTRKQSATIVPVKRIVREPRSYATRELAESLFSVPESELSRFGVATLLQDLTRRPPR